jgi:hypothetical protein
MAHSHLHYHLPRMKEMGRIYWSHSIGLLAITLAMIFVPIFLFVIGFSFTEVLWFILLQQVFAIVLQYPVSKSFYFFNPHYLLACGSLCYIVFFILLGTIELFHWHLALLAIAWALNRTVYWTAFHYIFGVARKPFKAGRQIAGINAITMLLTTIAPAIGGIIATIYDIDYVYLAASILLLLSVVPMLEKKEKIAKPKLILPWREIKAMRRDAFANMSNGIAVVGEVNIWALLVFALVGTYAGVGLLSSVIAAASIVITLYVGRREETKGEQRYIKQGIAVYSLTNLGRAVAQNSFQIFGLNLLGGISRSLYVTPFMNRYYTNSDGGFRLGYISIMEVAFSLGAALYIAVLLLFSLIMPMKEVLVLGVGLVAISVIGIRFIR